jgi:hypothetical protein
MPGPGAAPFAVAVGAGGVGVLGLMLWSSSDYAQSFSGAAAPIALLALGLVAASRGRALPRLLPRPRGARGRRIVREVPMAIVPWGVLVEPDTAPRVLRWPAVRSVGVQALHTMQGGTPSVVSSLVTVQTERELLAGRTPGPAGLEGLTVNLDAYAEEASRPVALDLEGLTAIGDGATEPVMGDLLRHAEELCTSGRGAVSLGLLPGGYRRVAARSASPETVAILRRALGEGGASAPADPRPLAAILAVRLGAEELVPELLRLVSSPHPIVAAVARAAALRLGAPPRRAGVVDEVAPFLFEADLARVMSWGEA